MSETKKTKFFPVTVEVFLNDKSVVLSGMASERGVTRIALDLVPDFLKAQPGSRVKVRLDRFELKGVFCQQLNAKDSFFEVQFLELKPDEISYLQERVQVLGVEPFWQRRFPRIPVVGLSDPDLPVPNLCLLQYGSESIFANVINFTLGGIRIELMSEAVREVKTGARLVFDLIATNGDVFNAIQAEVKNIEIREQFVNGQTTIVRSFGMRIVNMDPVNARRYRNLIRDYCVALKQKLYEDDETP